MRDDEAIAEEMSIAEERALEGRRALDNLLLRMPIRRLRPRQPAVTLPRGSSADAAIDAMIGHRIGHVLITDGDVLVGIVTERDIVRKAAGSGARADRLRVEDIMTPDPECLGPNDPIVYALNMMGVGEFRHIPLVDEGGRALGSLSVDAIVRFLDERLSAEEDQASESRRSLDLHLRSEPVRRLDPRQPPAAAARGATVDQALDVMKEQRVGNVLITEQGRLVGIVTERDIVRKAAGSKADVSALRVEDVMTPNPVCLSMDDPIVMALNRMGAGGFRHIPLVDAENRPVGSLSVRYIVRRLVDFLGNKVFTIPPEPGQSPRSREGE